MGQVDVQINGRGYQIACDDGQEEHVRQLGLYLDGKVRELVDSVGQVGDARLLVMSSLLIADELSEAYAAQEEAGHDDRATDALARAIEALAERVEGIAETLEAS